MCRFGNPEILRAERAKADAGLAAALPMLAERVSSAVASSSSLAGGCSTSGQQAGNNGTSQKYFLNIDRYMELLLKERRHLGGVLATSMLQSDEGNTDRGQ